MLEKIWKALAIICTILAVGILLKFVVKLTFWLLPLIILLILVVMAILLLRRTGVIKINESVFDAFKRFVD